MRSHACLGLSRVFSRLLTGVAFLLLPLGALAAAVQLSPVEEDAAAHPFAEGAAVLRLNAVLKGDSANAVAEQPDTRDMGWRWPDAEYFRRVPPAAKELPADWSGLPVVRFRNTEVGGTRTVWLRETPAYDQWLLSDPMNKLHACISVERATRRVYFFEIRRSHGRWARSSADDHCYSCHPSGPRMIRTFADPIVDRKTLLAFNRRLLSYGACDFWGSEVTRQRGGEWRDTRCAGCHDGRTRGRLYQVHLDPIRFKTRAEGTMPPRLPDHPDVSAVSSTVSASPTRSESGSPVH